MQWTIIPVNEVPDQEGNRFSYLKNNILDMYYNEDEAVEKEYFANEKSL